MESKEITEVKSEPIKKIEVDLITSQKAEEEVESSASQKRYYNHQDRKNLERHLGLKKPTDKVQLAEYKRRRMEAGKQIHLQFTEDMLNVQEKADAEREAQIIQNMMKDEVDRFGNVIRKGKTYEEAKAVVLKNYEIQKKRLEKLAKREEKRKAKLQK